jgi:hypothetical protein
MKRRDVITLVARISTLAFVSEAALVSFAYADDNILCVQQELAGRGLNPGPLDGVLGNLTQNAAQSLASANRLRLPALGTNTAGTWCQALRLPDFITVGSVQGATVQNTEPNSPRRKYSVGQDESCAPHSDVFCTPY